MRLRSRPVAIESSPQYVAYDCYCYLGLTTMNKGARNMSDLNLATLWEAHCRHEFETRDVEATMQRWWQSPMSTTSLQ